MMNKQMRVSIFFLAMVTAMSIAWADDEAIVAPAGKANPQTGVFQIDNIKGDAWLVVPQEFNAQRTYPLVVSFAGEGKKTSDHAKSWESQGLRNGFIVLVPEWSARSGESSDSHETWILNLIKEVSARYPIAKHKIFLMGQGSQAPLAAYLAVNYPRQFAAAALMNGSWEGSLNKNMRFQTRSRNQVPMVVALQGASKAYQTQLEASAQNLQKKGYLINIETFPDGQDLSSQEVRAKVYDWMMEKSDLWQDVVEKSGKSWREKFRLFVEENFFIR